MAFHCFLCVEYSSVHCTSETEHQLVIQIRSSLFSPDAISNLQQNHSCVAKHRDIKYTVCTGGPICVIYRFVNLIITLSGGQPVFLSFLNQPGNVSSEAMVINTS